MVQRFRWSAEQATAKFIVIYKYCNWIQAKTRLVAVYLKTHCNIGSKSAFSTSIHNI